MRSTLASSDQDLFDLPVTPAHWALKASRGKWLFPPHLQLLNTFLSEFFASPNSRFVIIELPVRHGKSEFISKYVSSWHVGMFPEQDVMLLSYSDRLAKKFSRASRSLIEEHGAETFGLSIRYDARSAEEWRLVGHDGGMRATSIGGTITGTGANLIIIDDPVKGSEAAHSKLQRDTIWERYTEDIRNRLEPGGKVILVMSRWHEDDLAGRLLASSDGDDWAGDKWERVRLPALAEPAPWEDVEDYVGWRDPLGRKYGDPLWPARYPAEALNKIRNAVGPIGWESNFQQRPTAREGDIFKVVDWRAADAVPAGSVRARRWDLASSTGGDYTVGVRGSIGQDGLYYVEDVQRFKGQADIVERRVKSIAEMDGRGVPIFIEEEPGSSGKQIASHYTRNVLAGYNVTFTPATKNKELIAQPYAAQVRAGNVVLVKRKRNGVYGAANWWDDFVEEHRTFPRGKYDDQVDAASNLYLALQDGQMANRVVVPHRAASEVQ